MREYLDGKRVSRIRVCVQIHAFEIIRHLRYLHEPLESEIDQLHENKENEIISIIHIPVLKLRNLQKAISLACGKLVRN